MESDGRKQIAMDAISSRTELFRSGVAAASDQVRGLLAGTGNVAEDQTVALGKFAQGRVDFDRFSEFTPKSSRIDTAAEVPIRAAQEVLKSLLAQGDELFVLQMIGPEPGERSRPETFDNWSCICGGTGN